MMEAEAERAPHTVSEKDLTPLLVQPGDEYAPIRNMFRFNSCEQFNSTLTCMRSVGGG